MPSLFNVIKNTSVVSKGSKEINTEYVVARHNEHDEHAVNDKKKELGEKNAKDFIKSYEVLARTMLQKARRESEEIVSNSYNKAKSIEEDAYTKGFNLGKKDGYSDGYSEGKIEADKYYEEIKTKSNAEIDLLNENAENMLLSAKGEYINYLNEKKEEIKELIIYMTKQVLLKEIENGDSITNMVLDAIEDAKESKDIIIKTKSIYVDDIEEKIDIWKSKTVFNGTIFVIKDDNLEDGKAVIEKENGKIIVDIMSALEKIEEIVRCEE